MKLLRTALESAWYGVRYAAPACAALIFIAVSAASVTGAHVQAGVTR